METKSTQLSVNERRRLRKAEELAKKKAERVIVSQCDEISTPAASMVEELDSTTYRDLRIQQVGDLKAKGINPYPHFFPRTIRLPQYIEKYSYFEPSERDETKTEFVAGRVMRIAESGSGLRFYDLVSEGGKIQVFADAKTFVGSNICTDGVNETNFQSFHSTVKRGDIVGIEGFPGKSKRGELSIFPRKMQVLTPCLQMLPKLTAYGLKDQEIRYRQRYLDLMINQNVSKTFIVRSKVINFLRRYLTNLDFIEVETPMMNLIPGGASARPFVTYHNDLDTQLYMRISPELYLKQLVIGGLERVFEIGKNFRNEGIDLTHNPEFTAIEFYMTYADYDQLKDITEDLVSKMALEIIGSYKLNYVQTEDQESIEVDFTPPWKRLSFMGEIEKRAGCKIPIPYDSAESINFMVDLCHKHQISCPLPHNPSKLLDRLCGHFVESQITHPTFITDHPQILSPLAKYHRHDSNLSERCELFILGREIANFYTELNDPMIQRATFDNQAKDKADGDDEAQFFDEGFCYALEYGLPPTGGWGLGIDRLTMFLTNTVNIKEVILFPAMRPIPPPANQKSAPEAD